MLKDPVRFFVAQVFFGQLLSQLVLCGRRVEPIGVNHIGDLRPLHRSCRLVRVLLRSTLPLDALPNLLPMPRLGLVAITIADSVGQAVLL